MAYYINNCSCGGQIPRISCGQLSSDSETRIYTENTQSISISGIGKLSNPLKANVKLSAQAGNILSILNDGLYASSSGGGGITENIYTNNGTLLSNRTVTQAGFYLNFTGGSFYTSGTIGSTPVSGGGQRMMWVPSKQAFRAGNPFGSLWDDANIGLGSIALGRGNIASGEDSVALGSGSTAIGVNSFAVSGGIANGESSFAVGPTYGADGLYSIAMGNASNATGDYSIAIGQEALATGEFSVHITPRYGAAQAQYSTAIGYAAGVPPGGQYATAIGYQNTAIAAQSMAAGANSNTRAVSSFTFGRNLTTSHYGETVVGICNSETSVIDDPLNMNTRVFTVGNGFGEISDPTNSNALLIYRGGIGASKTFINPGVSNVIPTVTLKVGGDTQIDTLTAVPTKLVGATANNVLGALTLGSGITIVGGQLEVATAGGGNIYTIDGTLTGARIANMNGYSLQFTNAGLFRIEDINGVGDDGVYDFNQGIDFLTYNATNSTQIFSNMLEGSGLTYRDQVTPANDVELYVASQEITLDNPTTTGTFFKIAGYNTQPIGSALVLADDTTGRVVWATFDATFSDDEFDI